MLKQTKRNKEPRGRPVALRLLFHVEALLETIYTSAGIDELLLAGIERVALGANFNGDVLAGGAGLDDVAAGAPDSGLIILGVDAFLHCSSPLIELP